MTQDIFSSTDEVIKMLLKLNKNIHRAGYTEANLVLVNNLEGRLAVFEAWLEWMIPKELNKNAQLILGKALQYIKIKEQIKKIKEVLK